MSPLDHALSLAVHGWCVFPVSLNKYPRNPDGCRGASDDPATIRMLHHKFGFILVGVATGERSNVAALDLDRQHGAAEWWQANRHRLPATRAHRTRSGGIHLWFRHRPGLRNSTARLAPGVDIRGEGGSCIYWPASGLPVLHDAALADWPAWLVPPPKPALEPCASRGEGQLRPAAHIEAALAGICRTVATAAEGSRNARLFWGAARCAEMTARGELSRRHAEAVLIECAARIGLDAIETRRTIASAFTRRAA